MTIQKPNDYPEWASSADAEKVEPSLAKQQVGWERYVDGKREKPFFQYFNWWMNLVFKWVSYFDSEAITKTDTQTLTNKTLDKATVTGYLELQERDVSPFKPESDSLRLYAKKDDTLYFINSNQEEFPLKGDRGKTLDSIDIFDGSLLPSSTEDGSLAISLRTLEGDTLSTSNPVRIAFKVFTPQGMLGQVWSALSVTASADAVWAIANKGNTFVSVGKSAATLPNAVSLDDGITWSALNISGVNAVTAGDSGFVAVGDRCRTVLNPLEPLQNINTFGGGYFSDNGVSWTAIDDFKYKTLHGVASKDGTYIATGNKAYDDYDVCSAEAAVFDPTSYLTLTPPSGNVHVSSGTDEQILTLFSSKSVDFTNYYAMFKDHYDQYERLDITVNSVNNFQVYSYTIRFDPAVPITVSYTASNSATLNEILAGVAGASNDRFLALGITNKIGAISYNGLVYLTSKIKGAIITRDFPPTNLTVDYGVEPYVSTSMRYLMPLVTATPAPTVIAKVSLSLFRAHYPSVQLVVDVIDISNGKIIHSDLSNTLGTSLPVDSSTLKNRDDGTENTTANTRVYFYFPTPVSVTANYGLRLRVSSGTVSDPSYNVYLLTCPSTTFGLGYEYEDDPSTYDSYPNTQALYELWTSDSRLVVSGGGYYLYQPFSVTSPMLVSALAFKIYKWGSPTADLYVELRDGSNTLLGTSGTVNSSALVGVTHNSDDMWVTFTFTPNVFIAANAQYTSILKFEGNSLTEVNNIVVVSVAGTAPFYSLQGTSTSRKAVVDAISGQSYIGQQFVTSDPVSEIMFKMFKVGTPTAPLAVDIVNVVSGVPNLSSVVATSVAVSKATTDFISGGAVSSDTSSVVFSFSPPVTLTTATYAAIIRPSGAGSIQEIRIGINTIDQKYIMRINNIPTMRFDKDSFISFASITSGLSINPGPSPLFGGLALYSQNTAIGQPFRIPGVTSAIKISNFTVNLCITGTPTFPLVVQVVGMLGSLPNASDVMLTSDPVLSSSLTALPNVTLANTVVTFPFTNPSLLDASQPYALILKIASGSTGGDISNCVKLVEYHELNTQSFYYSSAAGGNTGTWNSSPFALYLAATYTIMPFYSFRPNWPVVSPSNHTPITQVGLNLLKIGSPAGSLVVDIASSSSFDVPLATSSAILTSSLTAYATATQDNTAVIFNFDPPFYVDASRTYAVVVRATQGTFDANNNVHILTSLSSTMMFSRIKHYGKPFLDEIGFYTSANGVNWSATPFATPTPLNRIKATARGFLTTTVNGNLYRKNGTSWDNVLTNFEMTGCASTDVITVVVGTSLSGGNPVPACFSSSDDASWDSITLPPGAWFSDITVAGSTFFAVGNGAYLSQDSGRTWTPVPFDVSSWPPISATMYRAISSNQTTLTCVIMGGVTGTNFRATANSFPDLVYEVREVALDTTLTIPATSTLGVYDAKVHKMHIYGLDAAGTVHLSAIVRGSRPENKAIYATSVTGLQSQDCLGSDAAYQNVFGRYLGTLSVKRVANQWVALPSVSFDNPYPTPYALAAERARAFNGVNVNPIATSSPINWKSVCWSPELGMFCAVGNSD